MIAAGIIGQIPLIVEELARGGGGGSGGGGGGGGGGSGGGSGGGGAIYLLGIVGYVPMHLLTGQMRKQWFGNKQSWFMTKIAGWSLGVIIAILVFLLVPLIVTATHSIFLGLYVSVPIAVGVLIGVASGLGAWTNKLKRNTKLKKAVATYASKDSVWTEKNIIAYVEGIFYKFQKDWTNFDTASMQQYMSANYYNHTNLMMSALKGAHRLNKVVNPEVISNNMTVAFDSENNEEDTFEVAITALADDQLYDDRTNKLLFRDKSVFTEYWRFTRHGNNWLFDGIRQETESVATTSATIARFAAQNSLYYSADWGWLLLPADGYLFEHGKFGTSDINNHVIGIVNNVLTQLYTYSPVPGKHGFMGENDQYLVVQTNVPKAYGRILVRRRSKFINWPVKGLTQVKMEWGEFNTMYDVYASDLERVTSFELLNPAFMVNLRDLPFEVNIEVVDNVVYLFTKGNTDAKIYASLYDIVLKAHKEMKL